MGKILVAAAAGKVGLRVAQRLAAQHSPLRLLVRHAPQAPTLAGATAEVVAGDFDAPGQMAQAFRGIDAAFMYAPQAAASQEVFRAARAAGVRRIVLLSSASVTKAPPGANPIAERHRAAERAVQAAGLEWAFIRPDTMASNCLQWAADIREQGCIYTAHPDSLRNPVHEDDLALLAERALLSGELAGEAFYATGPEVLSIRDQVQTIATLSGREVRCVELTEAQALARMLAANPSMEPAAAQRLLDYLRKSLTVRPPVSADLRSATNVMPRSFADWVHDNLEAFMPPARNESARTAPAVAPPPLKKEFPDESLSTPWFQRPGACSILHLRPIERPVIRPRRHHDVPQKTRRPARQQPGGR